MLHDLTVVDNDLSEAPADVATSSDRKTKKRAKKKQMKALKRLYNAASGVSGNEGGATDGTIQEGLLYIK